MEDKLKLIKEIILNTAKKHNIEIDKIILFGSRARGDYREDSDWDILIVTKKKVEKDVKRDFSYEIDYKLIELLDKPVDIILVDKNYYEEKRKHKGFIYYWATVEGAVLK